MPDVGEPCSEYLCGPGLYCEVSPVSPGGPRCAARKPDGAPCLMPGDCVSGGCEGQVCGPPTMGDG